MRAYLRAKRRLCQEQPNGNCTLQWHVAPHTRVKGRCWDAGAYMAVCRLCELCELCKLQCFSKAASGQGCSVRSCYVHICASHQNPSKPLIVCNICSCLQSIIAVLNPTHYKVTLAVQCDKTFYLYEQHPRCVGVDHTTSILPASHRSQRLPPCPLRCAAPPLRTALHSVHPSLRESQANNKPAFLPCFVWNCRFDCLIHMNTQ